MIEGGPLAGGIYATSVGIEGAGEQLTDGNLGVTALAFTNPLYVDASVDAVWTPPGAMLTPS